MDGARAHRDLRALLPRTFEAFFARFPSLTPIQRLAVQPIVAGENVFLVAPTAAGKTEAALAPLVQRLLDEGGRFAEGPVLLYVAPTRALVNDLFRRLQTPLARLGLRLGRKTADHPDPGREMPQLLLTTPESLDSLLARAARRLLPVRALVLDELHALDGRPRGDQLAVLIERLRRVTATRGEPLQIVMLGATVAAPEECARRYAGTARVLADRTKRPMRARLVSCRGPAALGRVLAAEVERGARKLLVFCNARAEAEAGARALRGRPPFGPNVFAHHGSLARERRLHVEQAFERAAAAVCFATSTLELGIDVGHVDLVALYGPPPDVSGLLQRTGRAGRRAGGVQFLALARNAGERLRFRHLKRAAGEGRLLADPPAYDPGTALQQAASLLFQNPARAIAPAHVLERLPRWQRDYWSEARFEEALAHARRWFRRIGPGHFRASEALEERFARGLIHGNIGGDPEVEVLEELTGRPLGTVDPGAADGGPVLLGGGAHGLRRLPDGRLAARKAGAGRPAGRFRARPAPPVPRALARDLVAWLGLEPDVLHVVEGEDDTIFVHGLGGAAGFLVHMAAGERAAPRPGQGAAFGLRLKRGHADWPYELGRRERLEVFARDLLRPLCRLLGFGPWFKDLPQAERERAVFAALRPGEIAAFLARAELRPLFDERRRRAARALVAPVGAARG